MQIDLDTEIAQIDAARREAKAQIRAMQDELLRLEGAQRILEKLAAIAAAAEPTQPSPPPGAFDLGDEEDGVTGPGVAGRSRVEPVALVGAGAGSNGTHE